MEAKVRALIVIGDSSVVIKTMLEKSSTMGSKLAIIIAWTKMEASTFLKTSYYQIKQELNYEVDLRTKKHTKLSLGEYVKNGVHSFCIIL